MNKLITITILLLALNLNAQSIKKNLGSYYSDTFNRSYEITTTFVNDDYITINLAASSSENIDDTLTLIINEYKIENFKTLLVILQGTYEKWKTAAIKNNLPDFKKEIDIDALYNTPYIKKDKYLTLYYIESKSFVAQFELKAVFTHFDGKYSLVLSNKNELNDFVGKSKSSHQGFYISFSSKKHITKFLKEINLDKAKAKFK